MTEPFDGAMANHGAHADYLHDVDDAPAAAPWIILCDFDGTISLRDVTDRLLERFGQPGCEALENAWEAGEIGSRECMSGQIALLDASKAELDACLRTIDIDPGFKPFVAMAQARGIAVQVISDGLDYAIHSILSRHDLDSLPIAANRLKQVGERGWQLQFPHARAACRQASGNCKCARLEQRRQHREKIIFVGDGSSDFCAAGRADVVLAKDRLIDYCRQHDIKHIPIQSFQEALSLLPGILQNAVTADAGEEQPQTLTLKARRQVSA